MYLLIFFLYFIFTSIIFYIINKKNADLAYYFLKIIAILMLCKTFIYLYFSIKGYTFCKSITTLFCGGK